MLKKFDKACQNAEFKSSGSALNVYCGCLVACGLYMTDNPDPLSGKCFNDVGHIKDASAKHFQANVVGGKLPKELHKWPKKDADKDESAEEDDDAKEDDSNLSAAQTNQDQGKTKRIASEQGFSVGNIYVQKGIGANGRVFTLNKVSISE